MSKDENSTNIENLGIKDETEILQGLRTLFSYAFTLNCHLDDSSITSEEKETLKTLDLVEIFENLRDIVLDLLKFKQQFKSSEIAELAYRSDQFESMIQKLEAKVRKHIGLEQQLKLHIENSQVQREELEKINTKLKQEANHVVSENHENEIKNLKEKISDFEKEVKKKEGDLMRVTNENLKLRKIIENKSRQMNILRKEIKTKGDYPESSDYIKRQIEEQNSEIVKIQQKLKKDIYGKFPRKHIRQRSSKRNYSPSNGSQFLSPAFKIAQKYIKGHSKNFSEIQ